MTECVLFIASAKIPTKEKVQFKLALNKTFCLIPPLLTHRRLKHHQRTIIDKTMPPPHRLSTQS